MTFILVCCFCYDDNGGVEYSVGFLVSHIEREWVLSSVRSFRILYLIYVSAALFSCTTIVQLNGNNLLHLQIVLQRNSYFFSLSNTHTHTHTYTYMYIFRVFLKPKYSLPFLQLVAACPYL